MAIEEKRMVQLNADAAGWGANDIVPLDGELTVETNGVDSRLKVGDGASAYSVLNHISRRSTAEFDAEVTALIAALSVDVSAGVADAGKLVLLDAAGIIDISMLPSSAGIGQLNILGEVDMTAAAPTPGGGFTVGDLYVNTTTGAADPTWLLGQDVNLNEVGVFADDMVLYDDLKSPAPGWRLIPGQSRIAFLVDRDFADDTAAGVGGVPIGGTYHTAGALKVRVS